ncbi:hypothetical protein EW146_g5512 [Bondarzewia mesenterica]|uniref:Phosducin thioredoxin-like domain-containing protein n=1 Tax=Bondarzewia mesenterica TaxID=1095465 RepID=A0A4S4LR89_9AGAM|nr:hypothetical protein EW146_g5512 [Bondarzewia mesenterica]
MGDDDIYTGPRNSKVTILTAQLTAPSKPSTSRSRSDPDQEELDDDELFAQLEAEIENDDEKSREYGLKELHREMDLLKQMREDNHGKYTEMSDEKLIIRTSATEPRCVIHFYHSNFRRCEIMDKHLAAIAPKYFHTLFLRVFVESVPFLVEKLGVKTLPCVICFINGVTKDRIIGFEELGNVDSFSTATLDLRLQQSGVVQKIPDVTPTIRYTTTAVSRGDRLRQDREEEDFDFDLDN